MVVGFGGGFLHKSGCYQELILHIITSQMFLCSVDSLHQHLLEFNILSLGLHIDELNNSYCCS